MGQKTFKILDGVPYIGDKAYPWASDVRNETDYINLGDEVRCYWGRGFRLTFENGWSISIQWGWASYCRNYPGRLLDGGPPVEESHDAEIAAWDMQERWLDFDEMTHAENSAVLGFQTCDDVLKWIDQISQLPSDLFTGPTGPELRKKFREEITAFIAERKAETGH